MGTKTGSGAVSAQSAAGETVTITITKPDTTTAVITALTDANKGFSKAYTDAPGNYLAVASIEEDAGYFAATSPVANFTLTKDSRTITLSFA